MLCSPIMTKSKVLENGFLKPGGALDHGAHLLFPKMHTNCVRKAVYDLIIGDENKLCSIRCTCVY